MIEMFIHFLDCVVGGLAILVSIMIACLVLLWLDKELS